MVSYFIVFWATKKTTWLITQNDKITWIKKTHKIKFFFLFGLFGSHRKLIKLIKNLNVKKKSHSPKDKKIELSIQCTFSGSFLEYYAFQEFVKKNVVNI